MSSPRIGSAGSAPRVVAPTVESPKATAAKPSSKARDTTFDGSPKKKLANLTGAHKPVSKATLPVKQGLAGDVAMLRAAAQGGMAAPKLSSGAKVALELIMLVTPQGKDAVARVMADLEPAVAKEVFQNLPKQLKAEISRETPFGFAPLALRMAQVQTMGSSELAELSESMRLGAIEDLGLQLAVATELAARTAWGKENPELVDYQRTLIVDGKVNFEDGRGAGRTHTSGEIELEPSLQRSPEALAALLAHEATHSHHTANGGMDTSIYNEETAGNVTSARVWSEIGKKDDTQLTADQRDGLDEYAQQWVKFGEDGVQARVATEYAREASKQYKNADENVEKPILSAGKRTRVMREEHAKVTDLIGRLGNDAGAMKAVRPEYVKELALALLRTGAGAEEMKGLGRTLKKLPAEVRAQVPKLLEGLDKAVQKDVLDAMR